MIGNFYNRKEDFATIENKVINNNDHCFLLCCTKPSSGLTTFLRYSSIKYTSQAVTFYVDAKQEIPNSLLTQIMFSMYRNDNKSLKKFENYVSKRIPKNKRHILTAFLSALPWGLSMSSGFYNYFNPQVNEISMLVNSSLVSELILPFIIDLNKNKKIIVFIDNAQYIDEGSFDIIKKSLAIEYNNLKYIMGVVGDSNDNEHKYQKILILLNSVNYSVYEYNFPESNVELIKQLYVNNNMLVTNEQLNSIIKNTKGNLHRIISDLIELKNNKKNESTPIQLEVVGLLEAAKQPLRLTDIVVMVNESKTVYVENITQIHSEIEYLKVKNLIEIYELPDTDKLLNLICTSSPLNNHAREAKNKLYYNSKLYDYFSNVEEDPIRHSKSEIALLLYRLSKAVDRENLNKRAQNILSYSLRMGDYITCEKYVSKAFLDEKEKCFEDYFVKIAFLIATRRYNVALEKLMMPEDIQWKNIRICKVLRAIMLNRCRFHVESEKLIDELIRTSIYNEEKVLLFAYKISGNLHENKIKKAKKIFIENKESLKDALNFGYFLRNGSTCLNTAETENVLIEALEHFKTSNDNFGYYSTLANLGKCRCKLENYNIAIYDLEKAFSKLKTYGIHHLHIVYNNLGLCKMYMDDLNNAEKYLNEAIKTASTKMPKIYAKINKAALLFIKNNFNESYDLIKSIEEQVEMDSLDRIKQKYYFNITLICYALGKPLNVIHEYSDKSLKHLDRYSLETTKEKINIIKERVENNINCNKDIFIQLYDACYLEYWYQNPLELLPKELLSIDAV